ncbi:MAG TPA: hypothetical protein DFR83_23090 [Deltaproteobacteria bacterium]|nr:hypothetical protein [Deltaproteobacteria bacterium]
MPDPIDSTDLDTIDLTDCDTIDLPPPERLFDPNHSPHDPGVWDSAEPHPSDRHTPEDRFRSEPTWHPSPDDDPPTDPMSGHSTGPKDSGA